MTSRRRRVRVAAVIAVVVAIAAGAGAWWWSARDGHRAAADPVPVATATVVRTSLSSTTQVSATLGYAGSYTVTAAGPAGMLTAVAAVGQIVRRGQPVYEVDGRPVYLFYGPRPQWRDLREGVADGPDVQQLEQNLVALGVAGAADLAVDDTFTWATSAAVERWQQAGGQPVTGELDLGRVIYEPGPIRVVDDLAVPGQPVAAGTTIVAATSPTPVITAAVPPAQTSLVHAGDDVTVTLPDGRVVAGRVRSVSTVATAASAPSTTAPGGGGNPVSVPATVTLTRPDAIAGLDQAPVTVNVTDRRVTDVLAVPITALVAVAGGGYAVWVDAPAGRHLVAVVPGLFATTLVQVTASGLAAGDRVEIPAP